MKLYLDTCSLQRPLDDQSQLRIRLEAEVVLGLLALCESGTFDLVSSDVLVFEVERNPDRLRQEYGLEALTKASSFCVLTPSVEARAKVLHALGLQPLDALHLASAEASGADYLCTCDDRFLKRARSVNDIGTSVVSPTELIGEIEQW